MRIGKKSIEQALGWAMLGASIGIVAAICWASAPEFPTPAEKLALEVLECRTKLHDEATDKLWKPPALRHVDFTPELGETVLSNKLWACNSMREFLRTDRFPLAE